MAKKEIVTKKKVSEKKVVKKTAKKIDSPVNETKEVKASSSFAVIEVSGNQYLVKEGKEYSVKKLEGLKGDKFVCESVVLLSDGSNVKMGKPYLKDVKVECEIASQKKDEKVNTFRYTAKSRFRKRVGSRAHITRILIKKFVTATK